VNREVSGPAKGGTLQPFAPLRVVSEAEPQNLSSLDFFRVLSKVVFTLLRSFISPFFSENV